MAIKHSPDLASLDPALVSFDSLPDSAHVRVPTVAALHGVSVVTIWRWAKSGKLPAPIKRGGVTAWQVGQLRRSMTPA
jgi:predicted DNA-binding transcriptional regulator AlpA